MKFKLPRQVISQEIGKIVSRELRRQNVALPRASKKHLKEIAEISHTIEKWGLPKHLVCKKLPQDLGSGIFLHPKAQPILRGQMIAPYAGDVYFDSQNNGEDSSYAFAMLDSILLTKEEQALLDSKHSYHPKRLYVFNVDAFKHGNFTRFINHSESPNVVAKLFRIPLNDCGVAASPIEVIYLAKKTIHPGEQLLVSYEGEGKSYWGPLQIKPVPIEPKTFQLDSSLRVH